MTDYRVSGLVQVFSWYVVGWMVAERESATLAERFIRETCLRQGIARDQPRLNRLVPRPI